MASKENEPSKAEQMSTNTSETTTENHTGKKQSDQKAEPSTTDDKKDPGKPYAKNYLRISKDNLYMVIALWMEDFVEKAPKSHNKVGAVLVLPNDIIYAVDCSRDGVHAVQRLLMKHYDKAEGCKIFMSRKPCPMCTKLLVQAKVQRVLFLPLQPEYYPSNDKDSKRQEVDNLFTASAIARTKFVLEVDDSVLDRAQKKTPDADKEKVNEMTERFIDKYSAFKKNSPWIEKIEKELPWPAFNEIKDQFLEDFTKVMEWIARVFYIPQSQSQPNIARGKDYHFEVYGSPQLSDNDFNPVNNDIHKKQAKYLMEIARFLATRTDDPSTGVGAVIASPKMEILALGWNGFPLKALYGEFARASDKDKSTVDKKYPYVIHAEQNTLLMRNKKDIEGAILFVTKTPCNECTPLIAMEGIKTVVVDEDVSLRGGTAESNQLSYKMFPDMLKTPENGECTSFVCFQTNKDPFDAKRIPAGDEARKHLKLEKSDEGPAAKSPKLT